MKNVLLVLVAVFLSIRGLANPVIISNWDVNNTTYLGDAATEQGLEGALNNLISKSEISMSKWDGTNEMSFYDHQKQVETALVADKKMSPKDAKSQRVKTIRSFVVTHDSAFVGRLSERYKELEQSALKQNYVTSGQIKPRVFFESFFNTFKFLELNNIDYHIVFRSFGHDIDTAVEITENRLSTSEKPVTFIKGHFAGNELVIFTKNVKFSDKGPLAISDAKTEEALRAAVNQMEQAGQIEEKLSDFSAIEQKLTETKYLAIRDYHPTWAKDEFWFQGKKFLHPSVNSKGQEILPIFYDDNIEDEKSDHGIVHPIKWNAKLQHWVNVHPRELFNSQLFTVNTEAALVDGDYFVDLTKKALSRYYYRMSKVPPKYKTNPKDSALEAKLNN